MFNEIELFTVLVCAIHRKTIHFADFDPLYLENDFGYFKVVKPTGRSISHNVDFTKKWFPSPPYSVTFFI